jgi:hypothetical protein
VDTKSVILTVSVLSFYQKFVNRWGSVFETVLTIFNLILLALLWPWDLLSLEGK